MAFIPQYILIIFLLIVIDFFAGILIEKSKKTKRKAFLILSIVSNIGLLSFFKYFNFWGSNFNYLASLLHFNLSLPYLSIILPVGLSFHVFQSLSYTIEVFRKKQKAERNIGIYALYVMFYPQLVAGPIERPQNLLSQLHQVHKFEESRVFNGLKLMLWGLFKKMVIADRLAFLVNQVYSSPSSFSGLTLLIATYFFAFQIYCDFSGYTDIAIGAAQVMGIKLMENFNRPYFSKSVSEFWKRWHISLSSWFRDYLYIPLGGSRVSRLVWARNIIIVFLISGLWHGASWKYVVWGGLHGSFILLEAGTLGLRKKIIALLRIGENLSSIVSIFVTFNLVSFAWIFFRANSIQEAIIIVKLIFRDLVNFDILGKANFYLSKFRFEFIIAVFLIFFMELIHYIERHNQMREMFCSKPLVFRWFIYYLLILMIIFLGVFQQVKFIYFQF
jgi:D-alanyl-lipoteichoic acid acyltransferase DltB (MBOAT superfamily)